MGNKLDKNEENITNLNNSIVSDIVLIESALLKFEHYLNDAKQQVYLKHAQFETKLGEKLKQIENLTSDIFQKNDYLKRKLNRTRRYSFLNQQIIFKFKESNKQLEDILIESFYFNLNNQFTLEKKIKYLHLYNQFETIDCTNSIPPNCYNFMIIPLNRNRIFYCCGVFEKKSFLKITNKYGFELKRCSISPTMYYRTFQAYNDCIVGLFDDVSNESNYILVYDQQTLEIRASSRYFNKSNNNNKFDLWSILDEQIIVRTNDTYEYTVYNFNLELKFTLNLTRFINEAGLKNSVFLTGLTRNCIYLFVSKLIKKIDRKTGTIEGDINFETDIKSYLNVKMDSNENFLIKHNSLNKLTYHNKDGKLLAENQSDLLKYFNFFELTHQNDIFFCDTLKRKIYFI
jgi:hypothetical protein